MLTRSSRRKLLASLLGALAVVLVYEATVVDSRSVPLPESGTLTIEPGSRLDFEATAYCRGERTAAGVNVRAGIAAADPRVLPLGSVIQVSRVPDAYRGIYTVLDTGPEISGREIDLYIWNCDEAVRFGRRRVELTVLRLGWNQGSTAPANR
jgi:3D (Asp-Asp-Asp) domain-containing protein